MQPNHLRSVPAPPVVDLARIRRIATMEVMEADIDKLDAAMAAENTALGFFTGATGAALSTGLSWLASSGLTPARQAVFAASTLILAVFAAWFFAQWRLARAQRPALLQELRARTRG